ncbi:MAG: DUF1924 domain-containing protein [Proteobacteria bacterium]|jgi:hypothetical protein|nr:DUF1924 domain-containing protein [Pseudomonadota bacterium]
MKIRVGLISTCTAIAIAASAMAAAETPASLLAEWQTEAAAGDSRVVDAFSAARGRVFFERRAQDWSCSSCHTADPRNAGRHIVTGKSIGPMAPASNPERFTNPRKVDKWFRRNCKDVLNRECTALEKGDVLTYLVSLK